MKTIAYLLALSTVLVAPAYASRKQLILHTHPPSKSGVSRVSSATAAAPVASAPPRSAAPVAKPKAKAAVTAAKPSHKVKTTGPAAVAPYRLADAQTCAAIEGPTRNQDYRCVDETNRFLAGETVHLWAKLENVSSSYQYQVKTYRDGKLIKDTKSAWNKKSAQPVSSYMVSKDSNTLPGEYRSDLLINVGKGFEKVASREYHVEVLSPVEGDVRQQCYWPAEEDTWAFCPHVKTGRLSSRGIALANDTAAWDVNLRDYADANKQVFPVAPGRVVKYGDQWMPGQGQFAAVLVEHQTAAGERWWSGYLHMKRDSIRLQVGQEVDIDTPLGRVGRSGTSNSHLHLVVYKGRNELGALKSFTADFRARTNSELRRVARQRMLNPDQG